MSRKKLIRIQETLTLPNIIQHDDPDAKTYIHEFLDTDQKVFLELGCGRGEYTMGLSGLFADARCLGVDIQGERIWYGAKEAIETNNENVLFFRAPIRFLLDYFPLQRVDEIWIPFPDPFPKKKRADKRLTSPRFLELYKKILKPHGVVNLKTDNENLYLYTKEVLENAKIKILEDCNDVYKKEVTAASPLFVQTNYEKRYLKQGKKNFYIRFTL